MKKLFKIQDKHIIELLKGSSISLILKVLAMIFGYIVMLYIANNYGAKEWGIYSLCLTILSIAIVIPKFGFDTSLVRIITELSVLSNRSEIYKVILKALSISLILSLFIILIFDLFSDTITYKILNDELIKPYLSIISYAVIPMVILTIVSATFQALKKTALFILFQTLLINIVFLGLLFIFKSKGTKISIFHLYTYSIVFALIVSIIVMIFTRPINYISNENNSKKVSYKNIFNISFPMMLSSSFALLMGWSDILMLSYFKTSTDVGVYNASLKLAAISGVTLVAINAIATPKFVEFYSKNDFLGLKGMVQNSTKMIFLTSAPILLILICFPRKILGFLGEEFSVAYLALIYLCISRFINAISGSVGYIMQMTDQQKTYQNIILIAFFINLILNFILIPSYGYTGAAIASSIAMIFWNIVLVIIIRKRLGFWTIYIPFVTN